MHRYFYFFFPVIAFIVGSCGERKASENTVTRNESMVPVFNGDSALSFVTRQVNFGPRVPNSLPHSQAADFLEACLKSYGASVTVQSFQAQSFDGVQLNLKNIIAGFYPTEPKRILLAAHWDTRPFADKDTENLDAPMDGANDGASGVGVLLEVARLVGENPPGVGVDIILFDGEDWGEKNYEGKLIPTPEGWDEWWCLGSQYWSKNKHKPGYSAYYGILLDMVGGRGARFYREGVSMQYAPQVVEKIWRAAESIGYSDYFVKQTREPVIDDHLFVNRLGKIPMVDIIPYHSVDGSFGDFHHTTSDNLKVIDKMTLTAVGKTVVQVIYSEN